MNSLIPAKTLGRGLVLTSALFSLHANTALAAEVVDDAQMQARDLLSGTVGGRAKTLDQSPTFSTDGHQASSLDPQDQARRLILGEPNAGRIKGRAAALRPNR